MKVNEEYYDWYDEICDGAYENLDPFISELIKVYKSNSDAYESVVLLEDLPLDCDKIVVDKILQYIDTEKEFVESAMAQIGNKPILSDQSFSLVKAMTFKPNEGDSDDYNSSKCGRASVALNKETPISILNELAEDQDWTIIYRLVMNESLDSSNLFRIAQNIEINDLFNGEEILSTIAMHKNSDQRVLEFLAKNKSENVRAAVALNLNVAPQLLSEIKEGLKIELPEFKTSYNWWDTSTSNWANVKKDVKESLSILGYL
jgi:hypothetical protein